mgnify:CR=1 FL=1
MGTKPPTFAILNEIFSGGDYIIQEGWGMWCKMTATFMDGPGFSTQLMMILYMHHTRILRDKELALSSTVWGDRWSKERESSHL